MPDSQRPAATPGAKMMYLIRRKPTTSREELVAHWFANHMPLVIASQEAQKDKGGLHATRYIATLFDKDKGGDHPWDGVAQLWWPRALPRPSAPFGDPPSDSFQEKAEPYVPWATTEYVVIDGALPLQPLTLNAPFPCTRSGFFKVSFLVRAKPGANYDRFFDHWLDVHRPNVADVMREVGGLRYVISLSNEPGEEPYAGMAELYFDAPDGWRSYVKRIQPDGMEQWVQDDGTLVLRAETEMIGIP